MDSQVSTDAKPASQVNRVGRVWQRLHQMYGNQFLENYGDQPNETWAFAILNLSDSQIKAGLTQLLKANRKFPPNLSEFCAACKAKQSGPYLGQTLTFDEVMKLAPPAAAPSDSKLPHGMDPKCYAWERAKNDGTHWMCGER